MLHLLWFGFNLSSQHCKAETVFVAGQSQFSQREKKKREKKKLSRASGQHEAVELKGQPRLQNLGETCKISKHHKS